MSLSQCDVPCSEVDFKHHVMTRKQNITNLHNGVEKEEIFPISTCTMASNARYNVLIVPEHSKNKSDLEKWKESIPAKNPQNSRKTLAQNIL